MPCISVIVPTYNVLPYLDRSMTSLLGQTHRDLDILLIDDGATDGCAARCDAYARQDPRVRVVHQPNGGLSAARNTGLDHAVGDFVAFLDPDDYADPHMLERLLTTLTQAQADTCFCRYYDVSADGSVRLAPEDYARSLYTGAEIDQLLLGMVGSRPHHPHDVEIGMSVWKGLYSLPILRAHHIRFLSEREYLSEDLLFHLDYLAHAGAVAIVPEPLYYYCQKPCLPHRCIPGRPLCAGKAVLREGLGRACPALPARSLPSAARQGLFRPGPPLHRAGGRTQQKQPAEHRGHLPGSSCAGCSPGAG